MTAIAISLICASLAFFAAPDQARATPEGHGFRMPPRRLPLPTSSPSLGERERARRGYELGLGAGVAHKLCPAAVTRCSSTPGPGVELSAASRPLPHFAWGLALAHSSFGEQLSVGDTVLSLRERATGLRLHGRLFASSDGAFDPYLEFGAGGGRFVEHGWIEAGERVPVSSARLAPLLAAATGARLFVHPNIELEARFSWTHWLLAPHERCNAVAFGACTIASPGHFDVGNAVWHWQLAGTFLFGSPH
jgi:hypothetical protein